MPCLYALGILAIVASGGGGGGDDGPAGITYTGNTDPAVITTANATRLVGNIYIGEIITHSISGVGARPDVTAGTSARGIAPGELARKLIIDIRDAIRSSPHLAGRFTAVRARTDLDETEPCDDDSGWFTLTGFIEDDGTGTLTLDYVNCREGGEVLDGTITVQVNVFDFSFLLPTDAVYSFKVFSVTSSAFNVSIDGSIHSQVSPGSQTEQLTIARLVARNNASGEMLMITNQVSVVEYDDILSPSSLSENITGRIYDSTYGYVDYITLAAITFSSISQEHPDGGQMLLTGSLASRIRMTVIDDVRIRIDLDLDGDASYENFVITSWSEIEAGVDLVDSDGDGMHDSWETAYGLDPADPGDAVLDSDGDGVSNYQEYLDHTHPTAELDQSFIPSAMASYQTNIAYNPADPSYVDQAQTFTVGITGQFIYAEVLISGFSQVADLLLDLRPTLNGEPVADDSAILGVVRIPASKIPATFTFVSVDFGDQNIQVTAGSKLAIVLRIDRSSQGGDYSWRGETGDLYASGVAYSRTNISNWFAIPTVDTGFKSFVRATP